MVRAMCYKNDFVLRFTCKALHEMRPRDFCKSACTCAWFDKPTALMKI